MPRLPVPIDGILDSASIDWTRLDEKTGYIYVRQIRNDLIHQLDAAVKELRDYEARIIDARGNSGGGFDAAQSFCNFDLSDAAEAGRDSRSRSRRLECGVAGTFQSRRGIARTAKRARPGDG